LISFETGRKTHTQSSGQQKSAAPANGSLVLSRGPPAERPTHAAKKFKKNLHPRSSERVGRAFALLTKTYHGSRVTGQVVFTLKNSSRLQRTQTSPILHYSVSCKTYRFRKGPYLSRSRIISPAALPTILRSNVHRVCHIPVYLRRRNPSPDFQITRHFLTP
jgi:hypothetical protein